MTLTGVECEIAVNWGISEGFNVKVKGSAVHQSFLKQRVIDTIHLWEPVSNISTPLYQKQTKT